MKNLRSTTQITAGRERDRHVRLHRARAARGGARSTRAPTSTRSAACSTRRSRARCPYPRETAAATMFAHLDAPPPSVHRRCVPDAPRAARRGRPARDGQGPATTATRRPATSAARRSPRSTGRRCARRAQRRGRRRAPGGARAARRSRCPPALAVETARGPFVGRAARAGAAASALRAADDGRAPVRAAHRRARDRQDAAGDRARPRAPTPRARPCSTAARTPSRSSPTSRSSPRSQHYIAHRETLRLPAELEPELAELARFVPALRRHLPELREPIAEDPETRRYRLFEAVTRLLALRRPRAPDGADPRRPALGRHARPRCCSATCCRTPSRCGCSCSARSATPTARARRARASCWRGCAATPRSSGSRSTGSTPPRREALVAAHGGSVTRRSCAGCSDGDRGQPVLHRGDAAQPGRGRRRVELERALSRIARARGRQGDDRARASRSLGETANQVLSVAAVVGREFRLEVLEALIDEPDERIIDALEEAVDAGLVREVDDESTASCSPTRSCARRSTSARARAAACACTTGSARRWRTLGRRRTRPSSPTTSSRAATSTARARRSTTRCAAAEQAAAALRLRGGAEHYRRALERCATTRRGAASCCSRSAAPSCAPATPRRARRSPRPPRSRAARTCPTQLAAGRARLRRPPRRGGVIDREGIALLEEALDALGDRRAPLARAAARAAGRPPALRRRGRARRRRSAPRRWRWPSELGDPRALVAALESRHTALLHVDHLDERLRLSEELLALAGADRRARARGARRTTGTSTTCSRPATVEAARAASSRGSARWPSELRQPLYSISRRAGRRCGRSWPTASRTTEALIARAYEIGKRAQAPRGRVEAAAQLARGRLARGRARQLRRAARGLGARANPQLGRTCR